MKNVKTIIFDLGGVILNIDYTLTIDAFKKLGLENSGLFYSKTVQNHLFDKIETGKISGDAFINELQKHCLSTKKKNLVKAWNKMLLDLPERRLNCIRKLSKKYNLYLLSNTNEIHIKAFQKNIGKEKWNRFSDLFLKMYFSYEIGFRKPQQQAFQVILDENKLTSNTVLFIDDSPQHIEAAKKLGLQTHHLLDNQEFIDLFPDIIL